MTTWELVARFAPIVLGMVLVQGAVIVGIALIGTTGQLPPRRRNHRP